jgi:hypothetical protein
MAVAQAGCCWSLITGLSGQHGVVLGTPQNLMHNFDLGRQRSLGTRVNAADERARDLKDAIEHERANRARSLREIADGLTARGISTASKTGREWTAMGVKLVLDRVG